MTPRQDDVADAGTEATRKAAERGRETVRRVTEQVAKTAKTVADASQQTANASAELDFGRFMRRGRERFPCDARYGAEF